MAKRPPSRGADPAANPIYDEVRAVRDLVEQVIGVLTYTAQDPAATVRREAELKTFFGRGSRRVEVYLGLNKEENISELAESLKMKRQNVSAEIALLKDAGLAVPFHTGGRGEVWVRNPVIEAVVGLSKKLHDWRAEQVREIGTAARSRRQ